MVNVLRLLCIRAYASREFPSRCENRTQGFRQTTQPRRHVMNDEWLTIDKRPYTMGGVILLFFVPSVCPENSPHYSVMHTNRQYTSTWDRGLYVYTNGRRIDLPWTVTWATKAYHSDNNWAHALDSFDFLMLRWWRGRQPSSKWPRVLVIFARHEADM